MEGLPPKSEKQADRMGFDLILLATWVPPVGLALWGIYQFSTVWSRWS